jgi:hypothetical protein
MHGYHHGTSNPLRDSREYHSIYSPLGSVIIYRCLVWQEASALGRCELLRVSRLVGATMFNFPHGLPTSLSKELHLTSELLKAQMGKVYVVTGRFILHPDPSMSWLCSMK